MLSVAVGLFIGALLGAMGSGGSILTVPALVYLFDLSAPQAIAASLLVVGISAGVGTAVNIPKHLIQWKVAAAFALLGVVGSAGGTWLGSQLDENVLLLGFGLLMLAVSVSLHRRRDLQQAAAAAQPRRWALVLTAVVVGFLTGAFGVGGGFMLVPALMMVARLPMSQAAATSMVVIAFNCAVAGVGRIGTVTLPWDVIVPLAAAMVLGVVVGIRLGHKINDRHLKTGFSVLLLAVALYVIAASTATLIGS